MAGRAVLPGDLVFVTGANGFIGGYIVEQLLAKGYKVRAVVRDIQKTDRYDYLKQFPQKEGQLEFVEGELQYSTYEKHLIGCQAVIHLATPYIYTAADPQKEIVDPAVEGVRGILQASANTPSVKRVVVTSSGGAIMHFPVPDNYQFTDKDWNTWSSLTNNPYFYSKKVAEEEAWKLANTYKDKFDFVVVNPLLVFGPIQNKALNASQEMIRKLFMGESKTINPGSVGLCDVRDVADAHIIGLENPGAVGKRLIVYSDSISWRQILRDLKNKYPEYPVYTEEVTPAPTWTMDISNLTKLGKTDFRPIDKTVNEMVESWIKYGFVPDLRKK